jgi:hypothetical protein
MDKSPEGDRGQSDSQPKSPSKLDKVLRRLLCGACTTIEDSQQDEQAERHQDDRSNSEDRAEIAKKKPEVKSEKGKRFWKFSANDRKKWSKKWILAKTRTIWTYCTRPQTLGHASNQFDNVDLAQAQNCQAESPSFDACPTDENSFSSAQSSFSSVFPCRSDNASFPQVVLDPHSDYLNAVEKPDQYIEKAIQEVDEIIQKLERKVQELERGKEKLQESENLTAILTEGQADASFHSALDSISIKSDVDDNSSEKDMKVDLDVIGSDSESLLDAPNEKSDTKESQPPVLLDQTREVKKLTSKETAECVWVDLVQLDRSPIRFAS